MSVYTGTLTNTVFTISTNLGITSIGILYVSGTVTFRGMMSVGSLGASTSIPLTAGKPYFFSSEKSIDGFVIDASLGSCQITLTQ